MSAPFSRRIAKPFDTDAAGQATFYCCFDKVGCEEGERDGHIGLPKRGIALAVEHLASLGHRHICHIAGPQNLSTGVTRKRGFLEAAKALGLKVQESQIVVADSYSREAGARAASRMITQNRQVTALVVANDLLALGCYESFHASGIRCPADVSITGYNDMPPLTTVRVDHRQMGAEAAHLLLRRIANTNAPVIDVVLRPTLVPIANSI